MNIANSLPPLTIFAAEDNSNDISLIKDGFEAIGFPGQIITFSHGLELWETINSADNTIPNLFLIDLNMPIMDGFELIRRLNAHPACKNVPKIIVSISHREEDVQKSKDLNCIAFFQKPVRPLGFNDLATKILTEYSYYINGSTDVDPKYVWR